MDLDKSVKVLNRLTCHLALVDIGESNNRAEESLLIYRCVGESFAYLQLSIIISYIVRNYEMKLENPSFPDPNYRVSGQGETRWKAELM